MDNYKKSLIKIWYSVPPVPTSHEAFDDAGEYMSYDYNTVTLFGIFDISNVNSYFAPVKEITTCDTNY